jgi:hypothetical protein
MPLLSLEWLAETFPGVVHLQTRLAPRSLYEYRQDAQHYLTWCALDKDRTVKISKRTVSPTFMASPLIPLELEVQLDMAHTEALV